MKSTDPKIYRASSKAMLALGWTKNDLQGASTHWEGCHRSHPECAFGAGFRLGAAWARGEHQTDGSPCFCNPKKVSFQKKGKKK